MKVDATTTFSQIYQERQVGGQLENTPGQKHLRLNDKDGLHTHRTDKRSGIHFLDRATKHTEAAKAMRASIDRELGPGAGAEVFRSLGLKNKVKVSDLANINAEVTARAQSQARMDGLKQQVLGEFARLPDTPPDKPLAHQNMGNDQFRASGSKLAKPALDKLDAGQPSDLSLAEASVALKTLWNAQPTMPPETFAALMTDPAVSDAVGYFTGANSLTEKPVARDSDKADARNMRAAAERLKETIDATLTPAEKAALKERIDFLVDLAPVMLQKVGLVSDRPEEAKDQINLWYKSIAVSYPLFAGSGTPEINGATDLSMKEAGVAGRDFITALAIHRDIIFS